MLDAVKRETVSTRFEHSTLVETAAHKTKVSKYVGMDLNLRSCQIRQFSGLQQCCSDLKFMHNMRVCANMKCESRVHPQQNARHLKEP
eukprot:1079733-Amphidinium_carterae.2